MEKILIYSSDVYATFNEEGGFRLYQNNDCIYDENCRRKDRIVRRKRLPLWCRTALEEGKWIIVETIESCGISPDFYLKIRGKVVIPLTKIEKQEAETYFCDSIYAHAVKHIVNERERKYYGDFLQPIAGWSGWKTVSEEIVNFLTREEQEKFEKENPLPPKEETHWREVISTDTELQFEDDYCIKKTINTIQPHSKGYWYCYKIEKSSCKMSIEKNPIIDSWATHQECIKEERIGYKSKTLIDSYTTSSNGPSYESNDGMRMTYDTYVYEIKEYEVTLDNDEVHRYKSKELLKVI